MHIAIIVALLWYGLSCLFRMYRTMTHKIRTHNHLHLPTGKEFIEIASFLYQQLEEYGDPLEQIQLAMDYALGLDNKPGGIILVAYTGEILTGAVVINKTGMGGYIPENILVYIATHRDYRGKGLGKQLMQQAIAGTEGDIALHVEPDNPAKRLYESLGFRNKYLEMRLQKTK